MSDFHLKLQDAFAKHAAGDVAGAANLYRAVLAEEPEQPDALHMLGVIAQQAKNSELALKLIEASLAKKPDLALAWFNRCLVLRTLGRRDEALQSAREAVALDAHMADAWDMQGSILREKRQFDEAIVCMQKALALKPGDEQILTSTTVLLTACGRLKEAWKAAQPIRNSENVSTLTAIGNLLKAAGHPGQAVPFFAKACEAKPDFDGGNLNEAMARLQLGDMEGGWPLWEKRLDDPTRKRMPAPRWNGQAVGHLLLLEDQGMGDALQCLRYIPLIRGRAGKITLQITPLLHNLLRPLLPGIDLLGLDDPLPSGIDAAAQLMSLPALFGTRIETLPSVVPYINARPAWRETWKERLAHLPRPLIGLVWGGNPGNRHEYVRSMRFAQLAPIIAEGPAHFVSLQKGPQSNPEELATSGVFDAAPYLDDFTATAGLMDELDVVLTICSSPAHLAGAMGSPTWLMLCFDPHWVWLLGREDSPWYPSMRIFRQSAPSDWASVTEKVAADVRKLIGGDRSVLKPAHWNGGVLKENPLAIALPD